MLFIIIFWCFCEYAASDHGHSSFAILNGVEVKISDKFRPPEPVSLPIHWIRSDPSELLAYQYDFAKENGAISLAEEERLIKEQNELQEQLNNLKDEANTNNNGENEQNEDDEENEDQNVMDVNAILIPLVATANSTTTLIDDLKATKSKPINFHEFESQNENPFELVELQTLNELDELRCVLDPTIADSKTKKKKKNVTQRNDIDDFQLDVSLTKAMHVENGKPDEKLFDIDDESDGNVYENNVVFTIPTEAAQSRTNWINFDEPLRGNKPALDYFGVNSTNIISANNVYNLVDRQKSKSPLAMISGSICDDNIGMKTESESFSSTLSRTKSLPNLAESENIENGNKSELLNSHASDNSKVTQHLIESSIANTKNINFNDMQELQRQNNLQMQRVLEQSNLRMEENQKVINDIFANKIASRGNLQNHQLLEKQYLDNQNVLNGMFMKNVPPSVGGFSNTPPLTNHENASQLVTAHENIPPVISSHENKAHTIKTNAIFSQVASNENKNSVSPFKYTSMSEKSVSNGYANPFSAGYNPSVQNVTANETTDQFAPTDRIANIMKQYQFHRVSDSPVSQENTPKDGSAFDWYSQNSYKSNLNPFQNSQQGFNDERLSTSVFSSTTNTSTSSIAVSNKAPIHNFNSTNSGSYTFANTSQQNYRPPYPVATVNIDQSRNSIGKISQSNTSVTNLDQSPGSLVNTAQTSVPFSTQSYGISQNSFQKIPSYPSLPISSPGDVVSPGHSVSSSDNKSSTHQLPMTRGSPSNIPPTWERPVPAPRPNSSIGIVTQPKPSPKPVAPPRVVQSWLVDETSKLTASELNFAKQLSAMGFSLPCVSRTVKRLGKDEKEVLDFLFLVQELKEKGNDTDDSEMALINNNNDMEKTISYLKMVATFRELGFQPLSIHQALKETSCDENKALDYLTR